MFLFLTEKVGIISINALIIKQFSSNPGFLPLFLEKRRFLLENGVNRLWGKNLAIFRLTIR
jgi:hypothetical protein